VYESKVWGDLNMIATKNYFVQKLMDLHNISNGVCRKTGSLPIGIGISLAKTENPVVFG